MIVSTATNGSARVLIVEDEPDIATTLEHILTRERFRVSVAENGEDALQESNNEPPDLVLLDLMLPDMSGLEVLKALKRNERTAGARVIVLTAKKDEIDRILGFELGADDYVTKPFSPRELVLRSRAVLARGRASSASSPAPTDGAPTRGDDEHVLRAGPIEINAELHKAWVDGDAIDLTLTEFRLLSELVRASGRVRSRESLLAEVWGYDSEVLSRTVDTHIRRLRRKLGAAAHWLTTVRGIGYRIQNPVGDR